MNYSPNRWASKAAISHVKTKVPRSVHAIYSEVAARLGLTIPALYTHILCWMADGQTGETLAAAILEARQVNNDTEEVN